MADVPNEVSKYFSKIGRKGVKARVKKQTPERRKEIAKNAIAARWNKAAKRKKK